MVEFYAATPGASTIKIMLASALKLDVAVNDVGVALMHAPLLEDEEYYTEVPEGDDTVPQDGEVYVWKLDKAMNGLRPAPHGSFILPRS